MGGNSSSGNSGVRITSNQPINVKKGQKNITITENIKNISIGINIGASKTVYSIFSIVKGKFVSEVLLMNRSSRVIPSIICYTKDHRLFGENSKSSLKQNLNTSYNNLSRIIGFDNSDEYKEELKYMFINETDIKNLKFYCNGKDGKKEEITSDFLIADFLSLINKYYYKEHKSNVNNISISLSIPDFYNSIQKQKLKLICESIEMKNVNLFNESSAITMYYGYTKYKDIFLNKENKIDPNIEKNILFIDAGHSKTSFILSNFKYNEFKVEYVLCDDNLGGRNFDELIFNYCIEEFKKENELTNIEITDIMRFKLLEQILKNRIKLSENEEIIIYIDSFYENKDIQIKLKRKKYEEIIKELKNEFIQNLNDILEYAKNKNIKIDYVEIAGDLMRTSILQNIIIKKNLKIFKSIIIDECTSIGAALLGNFIKGKFPIKNLKFYHFNYYEISYKIITKKDNKYMDIIFKKGTVFENQKKIDFFNYQDFNNDKPCILDIIYYYNYNNSENTLFNWKINLNELLNNNIQLEDIIFKVDYFFIQDFLYSNLTENLKLNKVLKEKKKIEKDEISLIKEHLIEQIKYDEEYNNLIKKKSNISQKINELDEIVKNNEDLKEEITTLKNEFTNTLNNIENFDSEIFNKSIHNTYEKLYKNKNKDLYEYINKFKNNNEEINNQINEIKEQYNKKIEELNSGNDYIQKYNDIIKLNEDIKKQLLLIYSNKKEKILDGLEYLKKNLPINDEVNYKTNFHVIGKLMNNINELEKLKLNEKIFKLGEIIKEYEIILGKIDLRNKKISISYNN